MRCLEVANLEPNFFQSEEYLSLREDLSWVECGDLSGFVESGYDGWFIVPIGADNKPCLECSCWIGQPVGLGGLPGFLDYQFVYDPKRFLDMSGKDWLVYRRNVRKWPSRCSGDIKYLRLSEGKYAEEAAGLLANWACGRELYDVETLARFAVFGRHRWGLFLNGELVGLNVADENYRYINYRLAVDRGDDFLQEYLRYRFYLDEWTQSRGKLVNDGGTLGSEGLYRFKVKMNPIRISWVYSGGSELVRSRVRVDSMGG